MTSLRDRCAIAVHRSPSACNALTAEARSAFSDRISGPVATGPPTS